MAFVYILQSSSTKRFYFGSTDDLDRRLDEHRTGKCLATRNRGPWALVYSESFLVLADARRREREIKNWKSSR